MKCPKCQKEIPETALFCPKCGQKLEKTPENPGTEKTENTVKNAGTEEKVNPAENTGTWEAEHPAEKFFSEGSFAPSPFGAASQESEDPYAFSGGYSETPVPDWDPYSRILQEEAQKEALQEEAREEQQQKEELLKREPQKDEPRAEEPQKAEPGEAGASQQPEAGEGAESRQQPEAETTQREEPKTQESPEPKVETQYFGAAYAEQKPIESPVFKAEEAVPPKKGKGKFALLPVLLIAALAVYIGYRQGAASGQKEEGSTLVAENQTDEAAENGQTEPDEDEPEDEPAEEPTPELTQEPTKEPTPEPEQDSEELFEVYTEEALDTEGDAAEAAADEPEEITAALVDYASVSIDSSKRIGILSAEATSTIVQETTTNEPLLMFDNKLDTNWQEGVDGPGIGQGFKAIFQEPSKVKYLVFYLGNWKTDNYFYGNNRPKVLTLEMGALHTQIEFLDKWEEFCVELTPACDASSLTVTIDEVYAGTSWDDTVITDISLYRE